MLEGNSKHTFHIHRIFPLYHKNSEVFQIDVNVFSVYFQREANIYSVSSTVVLHIIKLCDNYLYVCVPGRQYVFQGMQGRKLSFVLYSDHNPPPKLAISVPAPGKTIQFTEETKDPGKGDMTVKLPEPSFWWSKFAKLLPLTTRCDQVFQESQVIQVLLLQDKASLLGCI